MVLALSLVDADAKDAYPRPNLLIEPAELAKPDVAKRYCLLDARPRKDYDAGHVPGAVWVDPEAWAKAFADGQDAKAWAERIGKLGIADAETRVAIYDDA